MQNRYVGDIGDYIKYALLRSLSEGLRLGVAWYLYPNEGHNEDGKHIKYLQDSKRWKLYDPDLFDSMREIISSNQRSITAVASANILPQAIFADELLAFQSTSLTARKNWRIEWFNKVISNLNGCDIVFADPDNGFCETTSFSSARRKDWKSLPLNEASILAEGRTAIFYHHNTRFKGGHKAEIAHWLKKLPEKTLAIYCNAYSCRTFFVVNPTDKICERTKEFTDRWIPYVSLVLVEQQNERF